MNKRKFHHVIVMLRRLKLWQLVLLMIAWGLLAAYLLRQNNLRMITLRDAVKRADQQNQNTARALTGLRNYVTTHMNTSLGDSGIYLEASYQRAYDQAVQAAAGSGAASSVVYQQADKACQDLFIRTASFPAYVQCVSDRVAAGGSAKDPAVAIHAPPVDMFRYNFVSPAWSPDAAGIVLLLALLLAVVITGRLAAMWVIYVLLRHRHRVS